MSENQDCFGEIHLDLNASIAHTTGPLTWLDKKKNRVKLRGVEYGSDKPEGCGSPGVPTVFGDVIAVLDWINKETNGCNKRNCKNRGVCMTGDDLGDHTRKFYED